MDDCVLPHTRILVAFVGLTLGCGTVSDPSPGRAPSEPVREESGDVAPESGGEVAPANPSTCHRDSDCHHDDPCNATACVTGPVPQAQTCTRSGSPPGPCVCYEGACAMRSEPERAPVDERECDEIEHRCRVVIAQGRCEVSNEPRPSAPTSLTGPRCFCDGRVPRRCRFQWVDPVPCSTNRDCWFEYEPLRAVSRPARLRNREFRPCRDGSHAPLCVDGACTLSPLSC